VINRGLLSSFTASSLIHLALIPLAALVMHAKPLKPIMVPIEIIEIAPPAELRKKVEVAPPPPPPPKAKPKPQNITAPKLISKPEINTKPQPPVGNTKEEIEEPEPVVEPPPPLASMPEKPGSVQGGWNTGSRADEAEGNAAGAGNLFDKGDVGVVGGTGVEGGGGGEGTSGLGRRTEGDGAGGGGVSSGEALSGLARPLGGYQVKPRYPESARRAGFQGVTRLRVHVLESGRVGEVMIDQSAGFRDLDVAAMDAVKKWRFEPARRGKEPVSVWVMLPVKFELN
jgi:periplasmic protein TonB